MNAFQYEVERNDLVDSKKSALGSEVKTLQWLHVLAEGIVYFSSCSSFHNLQTVSK